MGLKLLKNIVLLFFVNIQIVNCNHELEHFNTKQQHGIILHFPKYSIKVFAERKTHPNIYQNEHFVPHSSDTIYSIPHQPPIYQPYPPMYQPSIYQATEHKPTIEYIPTVNEYPLIHREPIKKPICEYPAPNLNEPYDPIVGLPKSARKHSQTWFFGGPNWQTNNQNILRSETPLYLQENADQYTEPSSNIAEIENGPDPRSSTDPRFIHSSSKFIKVHKPFGNKVIISKQKIIGHHGGGSSFGGHGGHFGGHGHFNSFDHFNDFDNHRFGGGVTNVNKNTNIHVHSRNAEHEEEAEIFDDDNKREAKEQKFDRIIGSHLFAAPRWRRDTLLRKKRGVIDAVKVVTDHRARIDVPKTAENVGAATRNLFEEDYSPVYHLRNALASAHDVIYTMMNVRPNGLLIPCRYKIVDGNEASPMVGAINPELLRQNNKRAPNNDQTIFSDGDPMQKMGEILRESVRWAHKSAEHAADAMHSARKAVVTARKHWPKLFVPYVRAVEIVQPRLGHEQEDIVGSAKDPEFVGVGRMMDYLGMTDKKPDYSPQVGSSHHFKTQEEISLQKAKETLGSPTYQEFMSQMKKELAPLNKENVGAPRLTPESIKAKLALERLRNSIKLQKAKADLQLRSKLPPTKPLIPKLPTIARKPLLLPKYPLLRSEPPKSLLPTLTKPPALTLNPILKSEKVGAVHEVEPPKPTEISDPIEELKFKINEHLKQNTKINQLENTKNIEKHLDELKDKLYEKYHIEADNLDHSDILGMAIEEAQKNNPNIMVDEVGSPLNKDGKENVASMPNPVYTKEMQTPFMGLATKEEIDKYFQQLYDSNNDKKKS